MIKRIANLKDGSKMFVNARDTHVSAKLFKHGIYEPLVGATIRKFLKPGMTFLDVGAHIGYFTLMGARCVGPTGSVISFEPEWENFALLVENIESHELKNVYPFRMALSGLVTCFEDLYLNPKNLGDHRMWGDETREKQKVFSITLDQLLKGEDNPQDKLTWDRDNFLNFDVCKMDVQGYENDVLIGMNCALTKIKKVILILEFWPIGLNGAGSDKSNFLRLLYGTGSVYLINNEPEKRYEPITQENLLKLGDTLTGTHNRQLLISKGYEEKEITG